MKKWYRSKTMWLNIAMGAAVVTGALVEFLPYLDGAVSIVAYKVALFVTSVANVILRKITDTGID